MLKITKNQGSIQVTADKSGFYPFDGTITFPTNSLFTATSANTDMITFKSTSNGDVQFVGNYKDITISGRSYDTKQKFLTAFSNLANQGSVDAYTKAETDAKIDAKQGKLKAGNGITLTEDATDNTTVVKTAVSLTDNGNGAYTVGDSIEIGGRSSVRIGDNNNVLQGQNSIVIGDHAMTSSEKCIAIGNSSEVNAGSTCSIVIGDSARAYGKNSVAIGYSSNATNDNPLVINAGNKTVDGNDQPLTVLQSDANGKISLLKGDGTLERMVIQDEIEALKNAGGSGGTVEGLVMDAYKVAVGLYQTSYTNRNSVVIGNQVEAYNDYSVLIGQGVKGRCDDAVVIGRMAETTTNGANGSVVIGNDAKSSAEYGLSIGRYAEADKTTPLVINAGVNSNKRLTMIQGDANGKISLLKGDGTDERMVIQDEIEALKNAGGGGTVDAYTKAETDTKLDAKQDKLTAGTGITITKDETAGTSTIATAVSLADNGNGYYTIGNSIKMNDGIAIGSNTSVHNHSIAVGYGASATNTYCAVIGNTASATYYNCTVIGSSASASNGYCTVIGSDARSNSNNGIAVGYYASIDTNSNNGIAVGYGASASGENSVAIGSSSSASKDTPLVIKAGYKTVDGKRQKLTVLQSDSTGKLSILKGDGTDERIVISDEITALKAEITTLKAEIAALKGGASSGDTTGA